MGKWDMPAPKQFKPGPQTIRAGGSSVAAPARGTYAVNTVPGPIVEDPAVVEVVIDDVTVVMGGTSKYQQRSFRAYGEAEEPEAEEMPEVPAEPVVLEHTPLGEWRSESSIDGTRYRRKESRLI
jgi:hypothetical protein